jgi:hypothetical protein
MMSEEERKEEGKKARISKLSVLPLIEYLND